MKFNNITKSLLLLATFAAFTSCSNDDEPTLPKAEIIDFNTINKADFASNGMWLNAYDTSIDQIVVQGTSFSHSASVFSWDGVDYYSWKGFCPTRSTDSANHPDNWTDYQWGAITGGAATGASNTYMLGMWDVNEPTNAIPEKPACKIAQADGSKFRPAAVYVTNSAYSYYVIREGSAWSKPFGVDDWCTLNIYGVRDGKITASIAQPLAAHGEVLNAWVPVDLSPLGEVDYIYFQMTSTDTGDYGMNNPAYFCLDALSMFVD